MSADVYSFFLHLHSVIRWVVLLLLLVAIFNSLVAGTRPFIRSDARTGSILVGFSDLMLLIGLVLWYFNARGFQVFKTESFDAVMHDAPTRFFAFEHPVGMLIAIILLHIGKAQGKKAISDRAKHRRTLIFYVLALLIILISIPWPFRTVGIGSHWY
jgi:ribose/xylose/arabinose/galactoside ABC-type transport system permease subunit